MAPDTDDLVTSIRNAGYMVRHYRGYRNSLLRAQAILKFGLIVREAFNKSNDFETLLAAVVDGLRPRDEKPF